MPYCTVVLKLTNCVQERLRQQAIKEKEKERTQFYQKQKEGQKDIRAKYREKVPSHFFKITSLLFFLNGFNSFKIKTRGCEGQASKEGGMTVFSI